MNLKLCLRQLCQSSNLLYYYLLSLRWLYQILSNKLFYRYLSQNHLRQMTEVCCLLRCPGCQHDKLKVLHNAQLKEKSFLGLPKGSNQRYPPSFSTHRIHCTTLSWLQTFCVEVFSLLYITTKFITVNLCTLLQGRVYKS